MLLVIQKRPEIRTLKGWAISALLEAGAPFANARCTASACPRAFDITCEDRPPGVAPLAATRSPKCSTRSETPGPKWPRS
jgi:hypothetical protein